MFESNKDDKQQKRHHQESLYHNPGKGSDYALSQHSKKSKDKIVV